MDIKHVEAAAAALVEDVVAMVRKHPQYAELVNHLTEQAIAALVAGL
jgi:hypothetical protein